MTVAGAATGVVLAAAGAGLSALAPDAMLPLAVALGAFAFAYALHEFEVVQLPVPGRAWQVPVEWLRGGFYRSAVIFGGTVGFGVFTRVPFALLPIFLAWLFVSGNVLAGLLAGVLWGATRAVTLYSNAATRTPEEVQDLNVRIMGLAPAFHVAAGVALAAFAAYLLTAPFLP